MVAVVAETPPGVLACLDAIDEALDGLGGFEVLPPALLSVVVGRLRRVKARVTGRELAAVRVLDAGREGRRTPEVLARGFGRDRAEAGRTVRVARDLGVAPRVEEALSAGVIAPGQAAVIAGAIAGGCQIFCVSGRSV